MLMTGLLWTLFVVAAVVGFGLGYSGGYVRGLHVGHVRGARDARDFDARFREQARQQFAPGVVRR